MVVHLEDVPDGLLVARAADGDHRAYAVIVRRHAPFLHAFAVRYLQSSLDADDVVQEVFVKAWRKLDDVREPDAIRAWLATAVARRASEVLRTRARRGDHVLPDEVVAAGSQQPEAIVERAAATGALHAAIDSLPAEQRAVWVLREIGGLRYEEIAARVEASPSTVRGRLARARTTIVEQMAVWR